MHSSDDAPPPPPAPAPPPPPGQISHLLAGLACYSLVDKVCTVSRKDAGLAGSELLRQLWLTNVRATSQFPEIFARRDADGGGKRDVVIPAPSLDSLSSDRGKCLTTSPRFTELCPQRRVVQRCCGRPIPYMPRPSITPNESHSSTSAAYYGTERTAPKISFQYRVSNPSPSQSTHAPSSATAATKAYCSHAGVLSRQTQLAAAYPKIVAVSSSIPIHGALVFLQMAPPAHDNDHNHDESSMSFRQYRVCQATLDADLQWCGAEITSLPPPPLQLQSILSQHTAFSPSKTIPLRTSFLTSYACLKSLPTRFAHGNLPIKLRNATGNELCINWPFVRGPNQSKEDFENNIKDILIIKIAISEVPIPLTSSILSFNNNNLLASIVKKDFGDYEVAIALESHRVFNFDCPDEEGDKSDYNNAHSVSEASSFPTSPTPSSSLAPAIPSSATTTKPVKSFGDVDGYPISEELALNYDDCNDCECFATVAATGGINRSPHVGKDSSEKVCEAGVRSVLGPEVDLPSVPSSIVAKFEERQSLREKSGRGHGDTRLAGKKRSIHDILMGDDSDSDSDSDRKGGGEVDVSTKEILADDYFAYDDYFLLNSNINAGEGHQECHYQDTIKESCGTDITTSSCDNDDIKLHTGRTHVDEFLFSSASLMLKDSRCHGSSSSHNSRSSCNESNDMNSSNNKLRFDHKTKQRYEHNCVKRDALQDMKAEIAAQIFFAEWESDHFFSNTTRQHKKLHIVKCICNTRKGCDDSPDETDPTTIPLQDPKSTIVGTCTSMVRQSDVWQVRLSNVHLSIDHKDFAAKKCKIKITLPDFLVTNNEINRCNITHQQII